MFKRITIASPTQTAQQVTGGSTVGVRWLLRYTSSRLPTAVRAKAASLSHAYVIGKLFLPTRFLEDSTSLRLYFFIMIVTIIFLIIYIS